MNGALRVKMRQIETSAALTTRCSEPKASALQINVLLDRSAYEDAAELLARFGEHALSEAANRAETSRGLGNVIRFCHWRQTERAIEMLSGVGGSATVH